MSSAAEHRRSTPSDGDSVSAARAADDTTIWPPEGVKRMALDRILRAICLIDRRSATTFGTACDSAVRMTTRAVLAASC